MLKTPYGLFLLVALFGFSAMVQPAEAQQYGGMYNGQPPAGQPINYQQVPGLVAPQGGQRQQGNAPPVQAYMPPQASGYMQQQAQQPAYMPPRSSGYMTQQQASGYMPQQAQQPAYMPPPAQQPRMSQQTPPSGYNQIYTSATQVPSQPPSPQTITSQQGMSAYDQQEMALQESKMVQQLEELKQRREMEESFRLSGDFDQKEKSSPAGNGLFYKMGRLVKGSMRVAVPAGAYVGSLFILRAAFTPN